MWDLMSGWTEKRTERHNAAMAIKLGKTADTDTDTGRRPAGYPRMDITPSVVNMMNHIPGGGNVLWLDGSVSFEKPDSWYSGNLPGKLEGTAMLDPDWTEPEPDPEWQPARSPQREVAKRATPLQAPNTAALETMAKRAEKRVAERKSVEDPGFLKRSIRWIRRNVFYVN